MQEAKWLKQLILHRMHWPLALELSTCCRQKQHGFGVSDFFEVTPLYFLMYVRHADKVAFKWVGTGVFNARSVWGFSGSGSSSPSPVVDSECQRRSPSGCLVQGTL